MNRFLALVLCSLCATVVQAQISTRPLSSTLDAYWSVQLTDDQRQQIVLFKSQTNIPDPASSLNSIDLQQTGNANQATIGLMTGAQNRLELNQTNDGNIADAHLSGSGNSLILSQTGGSNTLTLGLEGNGNRFMLSQDGGDRMNLNGLQKSSAHLEVVQGSGPNSLLLDNASLFTDPLSQGIPNLRIEQSGGASIQVTQGRIIGN